MSLQIHHLGVNYTYRLQLRNTTRKQMLDKNNYVKNLLWSIKGLVYLRRRLYNRKMSK